MQGYKLESEGHWFQLGLNYDRELRGYGSFRKLGGGGLAYFGVTVIRILLFRVLY